SSWPNHEWSRCSYPIVHHLDNGCVLDEKRFQHVPRDLDGALSSFEIFAECFVFDFDANRTIVADFHQRADEPAPVDFAESGNAGCVVLLGQSKNTPVVEGNFVVQHVLGMDMK